MRTALSLAAVLAVPLADEPGAAADRAYNLPLLVAGGLVLLGGIALLATRKGQTWLRWGAAGLGVVLLIAAFAVPALTKPGRPDVTVSIMEPRDAEEVPAGEPVTVAVDLHGGEIATSPTDEDGGHLHLYVDGQLQQMPYSTEAEITFEPGQHELRVEYVDHAHVSYDPEIDTTITVTAV